MYDMLNYELHVKMSFSFFETNLTVTDVVMVRTLQMLTRVHGLQQFGSFWSFIWMNFEAVSFTLSQAWNCSPLKIKITQNGLNI